MSANYHCADSCEDFFFWCVATSVSAHHHQRWAARKLCKFSLLMHHITSCSQRSGQSRWFSNEIKQQPKKREKESDDKDNNYQVRQIILSGFNGCCWLQRSQKQKSSKLVVKDTVCHVFLSKVSSVRALIFLHRFRSHTELWKLAGLWVEQKNSIQLFDTRCLGYINQTHRVESSQMRWQ